MDALAWLVVGPVFVTGALAVIAFLRGVAASEAGYRSLAATRAGRRAWWEVGGHVTIALLAGALCSSSGAVLVLTAAGPAARVAGVAALAVGIGLLALGELGRHRLTGSAGTEPAP